MKVSNITNNGIQADEMAKALIKSIEKISGVKILSNPSCRDFALRIKQNGDYTKADTITPIELTETQFNRLTAELQPLITA